MEQDQREIQNQHRQQIEKYVYYVLALAVSALGFTIYITNGLSLKFSQLPLGISVVCWGVSIYSGLKYNQYIISSLYTNNVYFETISGRHPEAGPNQEAIAAAVAGIKDAIKFNSSRAHKYFNLQGGLFYLGVVFFIVWHVLEMYLKSA